jgi:hypothetical protein
MDEEYIKIDGVNYVILSRYAVTAKGYEGNVILGLRRLNGRKLYLANVYRDGSTSSVSSSI